MGSPPTTPPRVMRGATSGADGAAGYVTKPTAGQEGYTLYGNGVWSAPPAAGLPTQTSHSGKLLTTDGTNASWSTALPSLSLTSTTASTGVGTGALQVAGGGYFGAASVFGSSAKINGTGSADSPLHVYESSAAGTGNGITVEQAGAGDSALQFLLTGVQRWSMGIDNSDADAFVIGTGALGSANALKIATTGAATFSGSVTANSQLIGKGTATNDNAASGYIGEYAEASVAFGSAVSLTTATAANVTSLSLTAGDWDVSGVVYYAQAGGTTSTLLTGSVSPSSGVIGAEDGSRANTTGAVGNSSEWSCTTGIVRVSLSTTTTYYLVAYTTFTGGTSSAFGKIRARRVR